MRRSHHARLLPCRRLCSRLGTGFQAYGQALGWSILASHEVRDSEVAMSVGPCVFEPKAACQGSAGEFSDFKFLGMLRPNRFCSAVCELVVGHIYILLLDCGKVL